MLWPVYCLYNSITSFKNKILLFLFPICFQQADFVSLCFSLMCSSCFLQEKPAVAGVVVLPNHSACALHTLMRFPRSARAVAHDTVITIANHCEIFNQIIQKYASMCGANQSIQQMADKDNHRTKTKQKMACKLKEHTQTKIKKP